MRSWLLDLLVLGARRRPPASRASRGVAADSGEGRWTVNEAVRLGVAAPVISAALFARFVSQDEDQLDDEGHRRAAQPVRRPHHREGAPMATPLQPARTRRRPRDGVVLFGATGDLAAKKLFPALYSIGAGRAARHAGHRRVVVGLERRRSCATGPARASSARGRRRRRRGARPARSQRLTYLSGDYREAATFDRLAELVRRPGSSGRSSTSPSRRRCSTT